MTEKIIEAYKFMYGHGCCNWGQRLQVDVKIFGLCVDRTPESNVARRLNIFPIKMSVKGLGE
jgi:hypothetical protein